MYARSLTCKSVIWGKKQGEKWEGKGCANTYGGLVLLKFQGLLLHVGSVFCLSTNAFEFLFNRHAQIPPPGALQKRKPKNDDAFFKMWGRVGRDKKTLERGLFPLWLLPVLFSGGAPARQQGGGNARKKRFLLRLSFPCRQRRRKNCTLGKEGEKRKAKHKNSERNAEFTKNFFG